MVFPSLFNLAMKSKLQLPGVALQRGGCTEEDALVLTTTSSTGINERREERRRGRKHKKCCFSPLQDLSARLLPERGGSGSCGGT